MSNWVYDIVYPLTRWLHVVCTTLIVGGTLFFELVLPIAIEDLKREQQLYVFARARLVFRWVVWISVVGLLGSGLVSLHRTWHSFPRDEYTLRWAIAHVAVGSIGMVIALLLTIGRQPPENPVRWMRLNLVILLVAIFVGSATRHFQMSLTERQPSGAGKVPDDSMSVAGSSKGLATQPATTQPTSGHNP